MGDLCGGGVWTSLLLYHVNILSTLLTLGGLMIGEEILEERLQTDVWPQGPCVCAASYYAEYFFSKIARINTVYLYVVNLSAVCKEGRRLCSLSERR